MKRRLVWGLILASIVVVLVKPRIQGYLLYQELLAGDGRVRLETVPKVISPTSSPNEVELNLGYASVRIPNAFGKKATAKDTWVQIHAGPDEWIVFFEPVPDDGNETYQLEIDSNRMYPLSASNSFRCPGWSWRSTLC
ncbi:MAG: hypothetical protein AB8G99_18600 [Planctomycetaceae bacterium]